jgi:hypothetical protein
VIIGCFINRFPGYRLQDGCFDLHNSAMLWAPRAAPADLPRAAVTRPNGALSAGGLGWNDWKAKSNPFETVSPLLLVALCSRFGGVLLVVAWHRFREPAGTTNTVKYYYCMRLAASFAGVSKPGQRSWIQGPVTKVFVGSNPIPRTTDIDFTSLTFKDSSYGWPDSFSR